MKSGVVQPSLDCVINAIRDLQLRDVSDTGIRNKRILAIHPVPRSGQTVLGHGRIFAPVKLKHRDFDLREIRQFGIRFFEIVGLISNIARFPSFKLRPARRGCGSCRRPDTAFLPS